MPVDFEDCYTYLSISPSAISSRVQNWKSRPVLAKMDRVPVEGISVNAKKCRERPDLKQIIEVVLL
jgi:hypothetical protein